MTTDFDDRSDETPAWANAIDALPCHGPFMAALARSAVTNSGNIRATGRWLLSFLAKATEHDLSDVDIKPIRALDNFIYDIEAMDRFWPAVQFSISSQPIEDGIDAEAQIAEFLVRRIPEVFRKKNMSQSPVTKAVALADRVDTLCGMFLAGLKPTGSKDPYALRRAALSILWAVLPPTPAHFGYR
jgi:hypothetical protein